MYGLKEQVIKDLKAIFAKYDSLQKVVLYGSRAIGNYRDGSDIDLTLVGDNLKLDLLYKLDDDIEELCLPYSFDISIFSQIDNKDLIEHIERVGVELFKK